MQLSPELTTPRSYLRPPGPDDYSFLREVEIVALATRWRHGGTTPSPESYPDTLWNGVLAHYLICSRNDNSVDGIVILYNPEFVGGFAYLAAARVGQGPAAVFLEGIRRFITLSFESWPFRKVYAEVAGFNEAPLVRVFHRLFVEEARLKGHVFHAGQYWDLSTFALWRDTWYESRWVDPRQ